MEKVNGVTSNGDAHQRNGDALKDKRSTKKSRKKKRQNSDGTLDGSRDQAAQRQSDVFDIQLRHRQTDIPSTVYDPDPLSDFFSPSIDHKLQMIIIGDRDVGKTCFLERYAEDRFLDDSKSTIGIDFRMKTVTVADRRVRLQIWDTAGQERFNSITTAYYRNAKGIILVYDVSRPGSFENLPKWIELVHEYAHNDVEVAIVGNKADLPEVKVDSSKARRFAEEKGWLFYEASAKESLNVDTVFVNLIYRIFKQIPEPHERNPRVKRKINPLDPINSDSDRRSSCCKVT